MEKQIIRSGNTYFFYSKKELTAFLADQHLYMMKDHTISNVTLGTLCGIWSKTLDMYTATIFSTKSTVAELIINNK